MMVIVPGESFYHEEYILPLHRVPSEAEFLIRAKVRPKTYAGHLMSRLYKRLFQLSLELKRDYAKYYQVEYDTFALYLRRRHLLSHQEAEALSGSYDSVAAIIRFGRPYGFMVEGAGEELLKRLLELED